MRRHVLLAGLLSMALAACSGAGASPNDESTPEPSVPAASTQAPTQPSEDDALDVEVVWDGTDCTYVGPTVIMVGALTRFTYSVDGVDPEEAPTASISGVRPGTSWDMVVDYWSKSEVIVPPTSPSPNEWLLFPGTAFIFPDSTFTVTIATDVYGEPIGGYFVGCTTGPKDGGGDGVMHPAALLEIAGP